MKMSLHDAECVQFDMYLLTIDDTPNSSVMIYGGSGDGRRMDEDISEWIRAVNLIYRCLYCGLWTADPYETSWLYEKGLNNYSLCKKLSEFSPFNLDSNDTIDYWIGAHLFSTEFGQSFVEGFDIKNLEGDVYPPFIEALEELFRKNGVPWEAGDLFDMRSRLR